MGLAHVDAWERAYSLNLWGPAATRPKLELAAGAHPLRGGVRSS